MEGAEIDMGQASRERSVIYSRSSSVINVRCCNKFVCFFYKEKAGQALLKSVRNVSGQVTNSDPKHRDGRR